MHGNESEDYIADTNKDISQLVNQKIWEQVRCNYTPTEPDRKNLRFL